MAGWGLDSVLSGKFMQIVRKEGLIRALERGKAARHRMIHNNAGTKGVVECVGKDEYGNRYYQDIHGDENNESQNSIRWVEYADRYEWQMTGRKLPPEWHGWLHRQYDDVPNPGNKEFEQPFYKRMHEDNPSAKPLPPYAQGHITNLNNKQFKKYIKERVYASWNPMPKDSTRYD